MPIYDRSVRELFRDFILDIGLEKGKLFTRQDAIFWFKKKFPKIKEGTILAHLIVLSTNAKGRINRSPRSNGRDDLFYQIDPSHFRLYDPETDPNPLHNEIPPDTENHPELKEDIDNSKSFPTELDLRNYLVRNLMILEPGLKLYDDREGTNPVEFPAGGRYIDILALDRENNIVVLELKVSKGHERIVGQLLRYMAWIETNQAEPGQKVRGIIVARQISKDLKIATSRLNDVDLFEYDLFVTLKKLGRNDIVRK